MGLIRRTPRVSQPRGGAGANAAQYPGLRALLVPGFPDEINQAKPLLSGGFELGVGIGGYAAIGPAAQIAGYVGYDFPPITISGDYSFVLVASSTGVTGGIETHISEGTGLAAFSVSVSNNSVSVAIDSNGAASAAVDCSKPTVIIGQRVGNVGYAYAGGRLLGSGVTGTRTGTLTGFTFGRNRIGNNNVVRTHGYLFAFFPRKLSEGEIASISANPSQLFAPEPRRFFVPAASSSGATAVVAAVDVMDTAAATAQAPARAVASATDAPDTAAASATVTASASATATDTPDTATATAKATATAAASATDLPDTANATANATARAVAAATDTPDTCVASGGVASIFILGPVVFKAASSRHTFKAPSSAHTFKAPSSLHTFKAPSSRHIFKAPASIAN